jgi:hypothetical protein
VARNSSIPVCTAGDDRSASIAISTGESSPPGKSSAMMAKARWASVSAGSMLTPESRG